MLDFFNNNPQNYKNHRTNSDLINIKDDYANLKTTMSSNVYNTGGSNTITVNELCKTGQKKLNNIKVMNLSEKKNQSIINLNKSIKRNFGNKTESPEKKEENKIDLLNQKILFFKTSLTKIPNITISPKKRKRKKKLRKLILIKLYIIIRP